MCAINYLEANEVNYYDFKDKKCFQKSISRFFIVDVAKVVDIVLSDFILLLKVFLIVFTEL